MTAVIGFLIALFLVILTLAAYVDRLYSEMGKFLSREFQENIDAWEQHVEPRLGLRPEQIRLSAALLTQLSLACLTLLFAILLFDRGQMHDRPTAAEIAQVVLGVVLVVILFQQLLPFVFFTRTRGLWMLRLRGLLRLLFYLVAPVTLFLGFLLSVASLAESQERKEEEDATEAVDALLEAGEEEGIIEQGDRELVRSAVEFGVKLVQEVMTPRPEIFAIPGTAKLAELLAMLKEHPYSRVPVYEETLDHITGIVFSHDLLHIRDEDAKVQTAATLQRPVTFVPETKKVGELLREMQREKQHMRVVIDEYGGVAGLVTIEDLLEEIVGSITDEHESEDETVIREDDGVWIVPGNLEIERLEDLLGGQVELPEDFEATTVAGLVSETAGRIPHAGEVIEQYGVRFEILASTDRRIDRLRISRTDSEAADEKREL